MELGYTVITAISVLTRRAYISLVRPHLEYASQVWNAYKTGEINSLEGVQKICFKNVYKAVEQQL